MGTISLKDSNYFSKLMLNYINQDESLNDFYNLFPTKENYREQAKNKLENYKNRAILVEQISKQLNHLELSEKQYGNHYNWSSIKFVHRTDFLFL